VQRKQRQPGRGEIEAQLAEGLEQARRPACRGFNPRRMAFCAVTPRGSRRVRAYALELRRAGPGRNIDSNQTRSKRVDRGDPAKISWARMLAYAGAYSTALSVFASREGPNDEGLQQIHLNDLEAVGTSLDVGDGTARVRVFTGLLTPFFHAYRLGDRRALTGLRALPARVKGKPLQGASYVAFGGSRNRPRGATGFAPWLRRWPSVELGRRCYAAARWRLRRRLRSARPRARDTLRPVRVTAA
jgi:hypothetical protein